jgi:L-lactate dehydrogenase complex protein LldF
MNGHCQQACPMDIPLPEMIRQHREAVFEQHKSSIFERTGLALWKKLALKPGLYQFVTSLDAWFIKLLGTYPALQRLTPFLGSWNRGRALMRSGGKTFQSQLKTRLRHD